MQAVRHEQPRANPNKGINPHTAESSHSETQRKAWSGVHTRTDHLQGTGYTSSNSTGAGRRQNFVFPSSALKSSSTVLWQTRADKPRDRAVSRENVHRAKGNSRS